MAEDILDLFITPHKRKKLNIRRKQMGPPTGDGGGGGLEHLFFGKGSQVEVSSDDIGFKDSWYVATIIQISPQTPTPSSSSNKKKRKIETSYLVEYATLVQDEKDLTTPLREYVDVSLIRPLPPPTESTYAYEMGDVVDAFHRDGWWTGVVVGVVNGGSKFSVFLENPPEEKIEFARADLRVHHDWVDCKWVRAEKKTPRLRPGKSSAKSIKNKKQQVNDPQKLNVKEIIEPKSEVKLEIGGESAMPSPAIAPCGKNSAFEKRSPIWGMLEQMEIFQKMPQQPHFSPLVTSKEDSREGLAIGKMVIFSGVVEKISKLQFSDPRNVIDSSLETLSELETHGFDVRPMRRRLNELLSKKENQGQLMEKSKGVEMRIAEKCLEKRKFGDEIREINKKMEELQHKRGLAISKEKLTDCEIDALKSKMDVIDQDLQNTQHDFEKLAAAPW
jgi:hypothetical protein